MKVLAALLMMVLPFAVAADEITLEWDPPTTREDGSELDPAVEIESYGLYCRQGDADWPGEAYMLPGLTEEGSYAGSKEEILGERGRYECVLTAIDTDGRESVHSDVVEVSWLAPPGAPQMPTSRVILR